MSIDMSQAGEQQLSEYDRRFFAMLEATHAADEMPQCIPLGQRRPLAVSDALKQVADATTVLDLPAESE